MHAILAIAKVTLKDALRKKVLFTILFFAVLLSVAAGFLPSVRPDDQVRQMVKISLAGMGFFGMVVAIFLSAPSLPDDISKKTIFTVMTKPARRWEIIAGKIVGLGYVLAIMLAIMGAAAYICIAAWGAKLSTGGSGLPLLGGNKPNYAKSIENHGLRLDVTQAMLDSKRAIVSGIDSITYHFEGLGTENYDGDTVYAKITLFNHGSTYDNVTFEGTAALHAINPSTGESKTDIFGAETLRPTFQEFPKSMIDKEGRLDIVVERHLPMGSYSAMASSVAVLSQPSGFGANFVKALFLMFIQYMLLVFIAVSASTILTSTVSTIFALFVYFTGSLTEILRNQALALGSEANIFTMAEHTHEQPHVVTMSGGQWFVNMILRYFYLGISIMFPNLSSYDLSAAVSQNEYISSQTMVAGIWYGAVYAAGAFLIAWLIFRRKEVA